MSGSPVVAHIGPYEPDSPNGVNRCLVSMVRHLPGAGVRCEVWHFTDRAGQPSSRTVDGVRVVDLPTRSSVRPPGVRRLPWRLPGVTRAWLADRAGQVDMLHLHSVYRPDNVLSGRLGLPYVLTPHGGYNEAIFTGRHQLAKKAWFRLLDSRLLLGAAAVHVLSRSEGQTVAGLGVRAPIVEIPNGVYPVEPRSGVAQPDADAAWLYVGRIDRNVKGLDLLLHGYAAASTGAEGLLPPLVVAGPDLRGDLSSLVRTAAQLGIADRVSWPGTVDDEQRALLLAGSSLFVHTSRSEGFPLGVLEALAAARACLVTPASDPDGSLERHGAVLVAEPTVDGVAEAMRRAAGLDRAELAQMGQAGRALVQEAYAWPAVAERLARLYAEALRKVPE